MAPARQAGEAQPPSSVASERRNWLTQDKPGTSHADVNNGTEPIEVLVVKLLGL